MDTPVFGRAAVAAPHHLAAKAGREVLEAGGNAIEAMITMAAVMAVVYPHMNSLGGDAVWLIKERTGRIRCIDACGFAGETATIEAYSSAGYDAIPPRGPLSALTVPGAIEGWRLALELSAATGGRLPLADLLAAAIQCARQGYAVSKSEARARPRKPEALNEAPGFAEAFLIEERPPRVGKIRRADALAQTLEQLAHSGLQDFYRGDVGRELAADLERIEAPISRNDLKSYRAAMPEPLSLALDGLALFNAPPPTQGLASLVTLGVFDRLDAHEPEGFAHLHGLIEAAKRALKIRDRVCVDPGRLQEDPAAWLEPETLGREAAAISMQRAASFHPAENSGDTVWMGAADAGGLVVSYIQSVFWEYGSGCVLPRTGVHIHNRGSAFSLDPRSRNALAPGAKPFHTLNPALAIFRNGDALAYGSMGGDGQPQFQAQILTRIRFGCELGSAVERPRFLYGRTWGEPSTTLKLEPRFDPDLIAALQRAGHEVELLEDPYSDDCGHAGAVLRSAKGSVAAAHDPRADGGAEGI